MAELGKIQKLEIVKKVDFGLYLDGGEQGEILMPKRYASPEMEIGDVIDVIVYLDGEERYLATTEQPLATVGKFACLKVNSVENAGAFLDWGVSKELLVPFSEQKVKMEVGRSYVVYVYLDTLTDRIVASMKLEKHFSKEKPTYQVNDEVELLIWTPTDLGYKVIVDNTFQGIVYKNEIFKKLIPGEKIKGYIKKVRDDDKLDITIHKQGHTKIDKSADKILQLLNKAGGTLPYNDKTDPEVIYSIFGMSKKTFKQSIGNLFKQRVIVIEDKGISLIPENK